MKLKPVFQPHGSRCCGQACIATLFGISLDLAVAIINKLYATRTRDMVRAIRLLGGECEDRLTRNRFAKGFAEGVPAHGTYLVKMRFTDRKATHWVVHHHGKLLDPEARSDNPCEHWKTAKYTSFLHIRLPKKRQTVV